MTLVTAAIVIATRQSGVYLLYIYICNKSFGLRQIPERLEHSPQITVLDFEQFIPVVLDNENKNDREV